MPLLKNDPYQKAIDFYSQAAAPEPTEEELSMQRMPAHEDNYKKILQENPDRDPYVLEQGMEAIRNDPISPYNFATADDLEKWGGERIKANEPGYGEVFVKSLTRGTEGLAQGVGALTRWGGDLTGNDAISQAGKDASDYWEKAQTEG